MAGWPSLDRVDDHRLVQELRAGDTTALTQVYDVYAPRLFDYCHALLRDQELAADAVHDSLIAATEHIAKLRQPERFRGWLYAIARNHCLRVLRDPELPEERRPAPEETDDAFVDAEERLRRDETRRLVFSAMAGLAGRHREAVDLSIRHELTAEEIAGIVGKSSQDAIELVAEARDELDNALAASIIARTGRADCPSVAALADEHDWPLPTDVCRKLIRHIDSCPVCRERRKRKVSTNRLMQVMPIAAVPADLRAAVLSLASAPDRNEDRYLIAQRAEPFDVWGWPMNADRVRVTGAETRRGTPRLLPVIGAAAAVLLVVTGIFLVTGGSFGGKPAGNADRPAAAGPSMPSGDPSASDGPGSAEPSPSSPTPTPTHTTHSPTPTPTHTIIRPRPTPTPTPTHTKKPKPISGALRVTGCTIPVGKDNCSISLAAVGGPVSWTADQPAGVTLSTTSGSLKPGAPPDSVTVTRTDACDPATDYTVTFSPRASATVSSNCGLLPGM